MSRINQAFRDRNHKAIIAYVTIGYPSIEATMQIVPALAEAGCDIIELGIPFSDPLADGPTIAQASYAALERGTTIGMCLEAAGKLRQQVEIPLVFMGYYNPIFNFGARSFCAECSKAGIDGLIIPDLPPDEGTDLEQAAGAEGIDLIYFLAPTSTDDRISLVTEKATGFIYLVSLTGVTGAREDLPPELEEFVVKVRARAKQPLCVGFGISTPEQARRVAKVADGVIVGSRIIQLIEEDASLKTLESFIRSLRQALD